MTKISLRIFIVLSCLFSLTVIADQKKSLPASKPAIIGDVARMNINHVDLPIENDGTTGIDGQAYYPNGSTLSFLYSGGIAASGYVNDELRVSWIYKSSLLLEWQPGSWGMEPEDPRAKLYSVNWYDLQGGAAYLEWADAVALGADFRDMNGDGKYDPNVDQPPLIGERIIWCAYNDDTPWSIRAFAFRTDPLGIEIQQTAWAYEANLPDVIFFHYRLINRSGQDIADLIFSKIMDPDIGDADDDLIGCDTTLNLGYCYNENDDILYGATPPAFGIQLMQGGLVDAPGNIAQRLLIDTGTMQSIPGMEHLPMTSFIIYGFSPWPSPPLTAQFAREFQTGGKIVGNSIFPPDWGIGGVPGDDPKFMFSGDPVTQNGWRDNDTHDKRFLVNCGPFQLSAGDTQEVVFAYVLGRGEDALNSITVMKENAAQAQAAFNAAFETAGPPPAATVYPRTFERRIELLIDLPELLAYDKSDLMGNRQVFEGFTIYQLRTPTANPFTDGEENTIPIARFDLQNNYGDLYRFIDGGRLALAWEKADNIDTTQFVDPQQAVIRYVVETDAFENHAPLLDYQEYYFAVVPFSINRALGHPNETTVYIEDDWILPGPNGLMELQSPEPIHATPGSSELFPFSGMAAQHVEGESEGNVWIEVVNREALTGDEYEINFYDDGKYWRLQNLTRNEILLDSMSFQGATPEKWNYPIIEGAMVKVVGPRDKLAGVDTVGPVWVKGREYRLNEETAIFDRGIDLVKNSHRANISNFGKDRYFPVKIVFDTGDVAVAQHLAYWVLNLGMKPTFVTAFDVRNSEEPRQLFVAYNHPLISGTIDFSRGNEIIIFEASYQETERYQGAIYDTLFQAESYIILDLELIADSLIQANRMEMLVTPYYPNSDIDVFQFSTETFREELSVRERRNILEEVKVVPNPYFLYSEYESRYNTPVVKFIHLDKVATIRIFDLGGRLIRTLKKDDISNEIAWNLQNEYGRRVASGIYIAHVEVPGVGAKILKFAVIQRDFR